MKIIIAILSMIYFSGTLASAQNSQDVTIKVLSFNIFHGETMSGSYNVETFSTIINEFDPDFVSLQEVDFKTKRNKRKDLAAEVAIRTGMIPLFGKAMNHQGGEYGNAVLSKFSFIKTRNVPLPFTEGREPRIALEITAEVPSGDTISFIAAHLDFPEDYNKDRIMQVKKINEEFLQNIYPTILAGDLNDVPGSEAINILEEFWLSAYDKSSPKPTFPSKNPERKIDYVMASPINKWKILDRKILCDSIASDHCAYFVTLKLMTD